MPGSKHKKLLTHSMVAKNIGQLVRVGRKKLSISQDVIAACLDVPLSHVHKIESGKFRMSAEQWFILCRLLHLEFEMLDRGYIDRGTDAVLTDCKEIGDFQIPERYANSQGSTVRVIAPMLKFVKKSLGEEKYLAYLRFKQIDPDFFNDYSHQLNINFSLDIMRDMIHWGHLNERTLDRLVRPLNLPATHGILSDDYLYTFGTQNIIQQLFQHSQKYEINCDYQLEDSNHMHIDLSILPNPHMRDFHYKDDNDLGDFLCRYKKRYFGRITAFHDHPETPLEELECHFKGGEKCVYRVAI